MACCISLFPQISAPTNAHCPLSIRVRITREVWDGNESCSEIYSVLCKSLSRFNALPSAFGFPLDLHHFFLFVENFFHNLASNRYTHIWPFEHARVHLHGGRHKCSFSTKRSGGKTVAVACIPTKGGKDQGVLELNSLSVMTETSKSLIQPPLHMMKAAVVPDNNEGHAIAHPHHPGNRVTSGMQTDMCSSRPPTAAAALPAQTPKIISPLKAQRLLLLPTPGPRPTVNMDVAVSGKMVSPPFSLCLPYQNEVGDMDMQQDVKLLAAIHPDPSPPDDYVNASYVQPLGTHKRYIATQGPLPATFVDFWT